MADEVIEPVAAPPAGPEPVVQAPAPEVVVVAQPAPAPASETPKPETPAFTPHTETPTLLQEAAKEAAKPADEATAKPSEVKTDAPVEVAPPEPRTYESFAMPEGVKADEAQVKEYSGVLAKYNLTQEAGQELMNLHGRAMKQFADSTLAAQHRAFADMRKGWRETAMSDDEIGGSGHQTAMKAIRRMKDLAVPRKDLPAFEEFLSTTGAGDNPAFLKMMHNFARFFDEPAIPPPAPKPAPDNGRRPGSKMSRLYDPPASRA